MISLNVSQGRFASPAGVDLSTLRDMEPEGVMLSIPGVRTDDYDVEAARIAESYLVHLLFVPLFVPGPRTDLVSICAGGREGGCYHILLRINIY